MLDRTGDTDCKVYVRTNSLTCLAYLQIFRLPACIHNRTGAAHRSVQHCCQILEDLEVLGASHATSAGNQDLRIHDIHRIGNSLHHFQYFHILVIRCEARVVIDHFRFSACFSRSLLHNARANRRHLRTELGTCDRSDGVAAECRTSHQQLVMKLLSARNRVDREITDLKLRTVCSQTCMDPRGYTGAQVTSDSCRTDQEYLRLIFVNHRCQRMCIGLCSVLFQFGIVHNDHLVCTVFSQFVCQRSHTAPHENSRHIHAQIFCKVFSLANQFQSNSAEYIVHLLGKDKYSFIILNIHCLNLHLFC